LTVGRNTSQPALLTRTSIGPSEASAAATAASTAARLAMSQAKASAIPPAAKVEMANRMFFRLYQCANMLHKTGGRPVEAEGLSAQQRAVLGALSRKAASVSPSSPNI